MAQRRYICANLLLYLTFHVCYGYFLQQNCENVRNNSLLCHNYIPRDLQGDTESVEILDVVPKEAPITNTSFDGNGWSQVKRLRITTIDKIGSYIPWLILYNNTFRNLYSLEYLYLSVPALKEIKSGAFRGLKNLTELELSDCQRTSVFYLMMVFENTESMPNLKVIRIAQLNTMSKPPLITTSLNQKLFQTIALRNITEMHLTRTFVDILDYKAALTICDRVQVVDFSQTYISNFIRTSTVCQSLNTLIITKFRKPNRSTHLHYENIYFRYRIYDKLYFFKNVAVLNMDSWWTKNSTIFNTTLIVDSKPFRFKEISMQKNLLQYLDVVIKTDALKNLEKLELQSNGVQYLNGESFGSTPNLMMLNMSNNQLNTMQKYNTSHFEKLFYYLLELLVLDLSNNGLTFIPRKTFDVNNKLKEIYIQSNNIEQISLDTRISVLLIDISNNKISYLNEMSRDWFDDIFNIHANYSNFSIDVYGNPFQCVCKYQGFLNWFVHTPLIRNSSQNITCSENGKGYITQQFIDKLMEECELPRKLRNIAISASVGFVTVTIATIGAIHACRRRRQHLLRRRTIQELIAQIQDGTYRFQFPVFLSYSSEDTGIVLTHIYPVLRYHLRQRLDTPRDLVCIGDLHFVPGRSIYHEIFRCLENSAVVLVVVSDEFCQSAYCRNELEEAHKMRKPIVLLFIEEVNEEQMTPLIRELFKRFTRINMRVVGEDVHIVPNWDVICNSILELLPV